MTSWSMVDVTLSHARDKPQGWELLRKSSEGVPKVFRRSSEGVPKELPRVPMTGLAVPERHHRALPWISPHSRVSFRLPCASSPDRFSAGVQPGGCYAFGAPSEAMTQRRWLRIIPVALVMYTISYVDRTN